MFASPFRFFVGLICFAAPAVASEIDREIVLAPHAGVEREDREIQRWQARVEPEQSTASDHERLAWAFVAKARRTFDAGFYKLAEKTVDVMDERFGASAASRLIRGHVCHSLHRFHEAEVLARQLAADRGQPEDFALLSDALMEQGDVAGAVAACQRLVNLRPGLEAYSRIAHLRWLKGDLTGATEAMEMAARAAGVKDAEGRAWAFSRLSGYYLQGGRTAAALTSAEAAERQAPNYAPAQLARGRALLAEQNVTGAIDAFRRAAELNPLPDYQWWLADALRLAGRDEAAAEIDREIRRRGETADPRTFALFLATRGEARPTAVRLARAELASRSDPLTHDALAWALLASGDARAAQEQMQQALAEGTRDARLFLHAGEIARAAGRAAEANSYFAQARSLAATLTPTEQAWLERAGATAAVPN